jgi:hypothetical protein
MAVNKVDLYVSQILEDLNNGFTWLKRDDLGYGSIQEKYAAKDQQIAMIRKHPKLKDAETSVTIFNLIDDTDELRNTTVSNTGSRNDENVVDLSTANKRDSSVQSRVQESTRETNGFAPAESVTEDDLSAFVNL